ncbi:hypothetical protein [Gracilimonas mengyeensis]|uniref:hypothetical protein n=1 Tax=Gracilimonas mengyeensis TaxID=1302730 RepID=UPI00115B9001|nr:hypothetical protein [Gracilimonas mengyeensis]
MHKDIMRTGEAIPLPTLCALSWRLLPTQVCGIGPVFAPKWSLPASSKLAMTGFISNLRQIIPETIGLWKGEKKAAIARNFYNKSILGNNSIELINFMYSRIIQQQFFSA